MKKINVLGISLPDYTLRESLKLTVKYLNSGALNTVLYLSTQILVEAADHAEQRELIEKMDLLVVGEPDILRAANNNTWSRLHEIENNDYLRELLHKLAKAKMTVFLLADSDEGLRSLEESLRVQEENLVVVGGYTLSSQTENLDSLINEINDIAPRVILSCLAYPLQARIMQEEKRRINAELWVGLLKDWNKKIKKPPFFLRISNTMYRRIFRRRVKSYQTEKAE